MRQPRECSADSKTHLPGGSFFADFAKDGGKQVETFLPPRGPRSRLEARVFTCTRSQRQVVSPVDLPSSVRFASAA